MKRIHALLALSALLAGACTDTLGSGTGRVSVSLARAPEAAASSLYAPAFAVAGSGDITWAVPPGAVASLRASVTAIEFLRAEAGDTNSASAWSSLSLSAPVEIDLMALPMEGDSSPIVIATATLAAGTYSRVRLFVTDPRIVFTSDLAIGLGVMFQGGVEYDVTIPSGSQTGIKTDASFTVTASSDGGTATDVGLLFDAGTTFANVTATGSGGVILSPVLKSRTN